jgi:hypothetical protein
MLDNEWETLAELLKAPVDPSRRVLAGPVGRLQALHWITRAATSSLDLDEMLSTVTRVLRETMRVDSCGVFLYDESSGTLTLRAVDGVAPDRPGGFTLPLGSVSPVRQRSRAGCRSPSMRRVIRPMSIIRTWTIDRSPARFPSRSSLVSREGCSAFSTC